MNRGDMIEAELTQARNYRREAKRRRAKYPRLAEQLESWADASVGRAEKLRCGPLFKGSDE